MGITIIVGIAVIANTSSDYYIAMILALISAMCAAFFSVINGKLVKEHDPKSITIFEMLGGFIGVAIFFALSGELNTAALAIDLEQFGHLFILGSVCTAFAFLVGVELSKTFTHIHNEYNYKSRTNLRCNIGPTILSQHQRLCHPGFLFRCNYNFGDYFR